MAPIFSLSSASPSLPARSALSAPTTNLLALRNPLDSESSARARATIRDTTASLTSRLLNIIRKRQNQNDPSIIPTTYGSANSGPAPGTVVGIVLGSVAGFLLILWLIYTCATFGNMSSRSDYTESVIVRDRRKSHHGSTRSRRVSETVEVRRAPSRSPVRIVRPAVHTDRIVVEERRETRRERSRGGSDEVVVIEDHSPPRRSKSKREKRESGGYRTVDPLAYGGVVGGRRK